MRPAEKLRFAVLAAQREGNRQLAVALSTLGITPAQAEALSLLDAHGEMSLTELGSMLICEAGTNPSRLVDRLVIAGLALREMSTQDRRKAVIRLSEDGEALVPAIAAIEAEMYWQIDEALGAAAASDLAERLGLLLAGTPSGEAMISRLNREK